MESGESYVRRAKSALVVEEESLLRGMPVQLCLRSFASVLSDRPATAEYFAKSHPVKTIGTFVSHNWRSPRFQKWCVMCFHYNLAPALFSAYLVAGAACALTALGCLPTARAEPHFEEGGSWSLQGVISLPAGLVTFPVVLLFLHEFDRLCLTPKRDVIFLDKTCVHQESEDLKRKGIQSLAAFLACSKDMLICYSDLYLQRLWTCYEVASWLMLHRGEKMTVMQTFLPFCLLATFLISSLLECVLFAVKLTNSHTLLYLPILICCVTLAWIGCAWLIATATGLRDRMEKHASNFTIAQADCASEDDKVTVRQNIIDFMKYTKYSDQSASDEEAIQDFEKLVQLQVPQLMRQSLGRQLLPFCYIHVGFLPQALISFDVLAGAVVEGQGLRVALLHATTNLTNAFTAGPLLVAATYQIMQRGRRRRGLWGCLLLGLLMACLHCLLLLLLIELRARALRGSDRALGGWLLAIAALAVATAVAYRPQRRAPPRMDRMA